MQPVRILEMTAGIDKVAEISSVNLAAKMLSVNAMVVAARAGEAGRGFAVVADEFKHLSGEVDRIAAALESQVQADLRELSFVGASILEHMRGQRLTDLALNAIEIIDRKSLD